MRNQQMRVGIWFYGLGTALTGILDIVWREFEASHQPIKALGKNIPGQPMLACIAGIALVAGGLAVLRRGSAKIGSAASVIVYSVFIAFWAFRYYAGIHALGWRIDVIFGTSFGLLQQLWLIAPAAIIYLSIAPTDSRLPSGGTISARWMTGLPPVVFGLEHLLGIHVFARIVPHWIPFASFWAALTGIAFFLAGGAICSGIKDVLAARLLALMLLVFEVLVEIPPIFARPQSQAAWGAAVYNLTAIGTCWIFAEFIVSRTNRGRIESAEDVAISRSDAAVA